jgi:small subunit ribosomal protein S9|uniref:ribosomal protein S9 n=1 Tax=Gephyrocapsa oceanica TaxID=38817 RepID=UPI002028248E|nr:ribosomal protein S9 [Gephyrocapsa oceanica]YP_010393689.1 ribosomal protein S9 [Gephyrocapsa ericsonii]UPY81885.1 ribosomal protein S9 [Emiliania huxleyi]UPY82478.1 ribosomal protein S9 [Emiliania huxleyi]UPY82918.1 ribosomal protein S9 [Emiliania huxleyi]UPY83028.1 ribosomal protein S9 [Emiliania huxleyi]UPY83468.1 ribosomal protein S9 [Emiliania huxleyi]|mmetsp:Transcript_9843/g.30058  ORF Transcript_9843/g.30058 Transcript_9843/m.30058 type:complete len:132 (-) Transcript_9843:772-1167(-)
MSTISYTAVGRRKEATAKVKLQPGTGIITVNKKPGETYFNYNSEYLSTLRGPLLALGLENDYDLHITAKGGGIKGQTDAVKLGLARAICTMSSEKRENLKPHGYLTRDYRAKERKKYGLRKARKAPQFSKR